MNRIIVAGGRGFFGSMVVRVLRAEGGTPLIASRQEGSDVLLDVEDRASIRKTMRAGDVIVDATAPFHTRTAALVDEAILAGADVVDLSDSLAYARLINTRDTAARERGVRLLNSCSSISVLSWLAIERSGIGDPIALHGFLAPATRHTANRGASESLLANLRYWTESREFAALRRRGHRVEMADGFTLPRVYRSLREIDFWVDPNTYGAGTILGILSRVPALLPIAARCARYGLALVRILGSNEGVLAYEIEGAAGNRSTVKFTGRESFLMAAIPAALAAIRLAGGEPYPAGVVPVHQHVDAEALVDALQRYGILLSVDRE